MLATAGLLDFNATIVVQMVIFVVTAIVLWKLAWGPLTMQIAARQAREASIQAQAAEVELRVKSASDDIQRELEQARVQAREIVARAHAEAVADAEEVRARSRREAEAQVEKARADIGAERDAALQELRTQVGSLVVEATARVIGETIDVRTHQRLIEESLAQVSRQ